MKTSSKRLLVVLTCLALAPSAYAQSPREQFQQMVEQLQKAPNDNALRERIIKLGAEIKPAPAVPEETERRMARGSAAFKAAISTAEYQDAVKEFEEAVLAAPWYGDAYFNLGVAQDKAGEFDAALRSLKLAQLASPDSKEIKSLVYEVEYRYEKSNDISARLNEPFHKVYPSFPDLSRWFCFAKYDTKYGRYESWVVFDNKTGELADVSVTWANAKSPHISGLELEIDRTAPRQFWSAEITSIHKVYTISADGQLVNVVRRKGAFPAESREEIARYSCTRK